jgi:hypothetical protein
LDQVIPAPLNENGVSLINQALQQYLDGTHEPQLEFIIQNGDVVPEPSASDRIQFVWKSWLEIQVIFRETVEVPDPF